MMDKRATIYVTYGTTESGDALQLLLWDHNPTDEMVEDAYRDMYPEEFEQIGFVNWDIMKGVWA